MFCRLVIICLLALSSAQAGTHKYSLGLGAGLARLYSSDDTFFPYQRSYGFQAGYRIGERWSLQFDASYARLYDDTTSNSFVTWRPAKSSASMVWSSTRLAVVIERSLFAPEKAVNISPGFGGGLIIWKMIDPITDSLLKQPGIHREVVDYAATEIILTAQATISVALTSRWSLDWSVRADYLTGLGAEFESGVKSSFDKMLAGSCLSLRFSFGQRYGWRSEKDWTSKAEQPPAVAYRKAGDSDGDGVPDELDKCLGTLSGVEVDATGCHRDTDRDGVSDGLDDCPGTDAAARGRVDIHGCPVDSDFDGIGDYRDACPHNRVGATVDATGCPLDSDSDGVPDGIDDCPNTLYGVDVDRNGCIDLSMFAEPIVFNIDYVPGSFEIDPKTRERLKKLTGVLLFVPDMRLEINGYTDNIGTTVANKKLSKKRARRVRDYLVALGIDSDRMKVFGRGETGFVASNQTADGRAKNRRIEIVFYR
ncbi:MAG: OmpA family protein [candidate division Zixibacteria bacterium]|nr:OmpA family protein [candidate division Zixibacteria bacterium]